MNNRRSLLQSLLVAPFAFLFKSKQPFTPIFTTREITRGEAKELYTPKDNCLPYYKNVWVIHYKSDLHVCCIMALKEQAEEYVAKNPECYAQLWCIVENDESTSPKVRPVGKWSMGLYHVGNPKSLEGTHIQYDPRCNWETSGNP